MGLRTFKAIPGLEVPVNAGTATALYTSPGAGTVVTALRAVYPVGGAGGASKLTVWRKPAAASLPPANQHIILSKSLNAGDAIELKNIAMDNGDVLLVLVDVVGPVVHGNVSEA
jgi:hypothetical protein